VLRIIAPKIAGSYRQRPVDGLRHAVWPIEAPDESVYADWCAAVTFTFVVDNATAPDRARETMTAKH